MISLHVRDIQLLGKKEEEISREICERLRVEGVIK
jgi:hypothetical protein